MPGDRDVFAARTGDARLPRAGQVVLVRHGVTDWNRARRVQGHVDIPLNGEGRRQAMRTARRFAANSRREPVAAVYSSDLARAAQTAEPIAQALGLVAEVDPMLRERFYGSFEGLTHVEIERDHAEAFRRWSTRDTDFVLPGGGESLRQFFARVEAGVQRIVARHPGRTVVAVTHGGVLDCVYRIASGLPLCAPRHFDVLNASLNRVAYDGNRFMLLGWADVAHLSEAIDDVDERG